MFLWINCNKCVLLIHREFAREGAKKILFIQSTLTFQCDRYFHRAIYTAKFDHKPQEINIINILHAVGLIQASTSIQEVSFIFVFVLFYKF